MLFQNNPVDVNALPQLDDTPLETLSPAYLTVSYIGTIIFFSVLAVVLMLVHFFAKFNIPSWVIFSASGIWLFLLLFSLWHTYRDFHWQGFAIRERDLTYRSGVFFRSTTVIPYNRIQHAEVKQGPIERKFNLKRLEIYSAGGEGSDLFIPGLPNDRADQLRDYVIEKVGRHEQ